MMYMYLVLTLYITLTFTLLLQDSIDQKSYFVLLHATWEALGRGAELLNIRKRIKMPKVRLSANLKRNVCACTILAQ